MATAAAIFQGAVAIVRLRHGKCFFFSTYGSMRDQKRLFLKTQPIPFGASERKPNIWGHRETTEFVELSRLAERAIRTEPFLNLVANQDNCK